MKHICRSLPILLLIILTVCCKKKEHTKISESEKKEVIQSKFAKNYPDFDFKVLQDSLLVTVYSDSILTPYYITTENTPAWIHDTLDVKNLNRLVEILNSVNEHGLNPDLFSATYIKSITDSIDSGSYINKIDTLYSRIATLEKVATKAAIKYISGMKYGFLNPKKLYGTDYDITIATPDSAFYANLYDEIKKDPIEAMLNSQPTDHIYLRLREEYHLLEGKKEENFKKIESGNATFKVGDKNKHISAIAERLIMTGEYLPDSTSTDSTHNKLNNELLAAINTFRRHNSYPEELEVGKLTIDALNRPFEYYQEKICINMERYRWKRTKSKHNKHIEVNVASAMLLADQADNDSLSLISRVCVGSIRNKTPLLQSDISYINLNPYWNVPRSIAQNEVVILQKKDPTYIERHNMKLFKGGKEVDPSSIDWKEVNPSKFSYIIRQEPGGGNSLGLVKFMFNNAFSVYLHDTPSKAAFGRKNRAVSHGCIRVQKPFDLVFFCTAPATELFKDQFYHSIDKTPISEKGKKLLKEDKLKKLPNIINIDKENQISLFIDYYTVYMYPNDSALYYADDVYEYDTPILTELGLNKYP
ncbi:L,D-transpeptidase family protein [Dysgonomonas sp. Marseille-P4677]|uniref:L,D-transpeptidase family protein n=1 Tax=Dysgonomonas sp. Marseille-P4677 TaxID=2364790 RepID=UPI001914C755|nr:L,D-transpeptidase family protein [Dysgonomonas sp. Marseille-P4677]MBK5721188.1 L,D-transpeptidase family protein [Dysgonomonas sp. Marseille-P4677]